MASNFTNQVIAAVDVGGSTYKITGVELIHTESGWSTSTYVPVHGEVVIYDKDNNHPYYRTKVGDGTNLVKNLPFMFSGCINDLVQSPTQTIVLNAGTANTVI